MVNGQKEIWVKTESNFDRKYNVIAFSNCGRIMRADGSCEEAKELSRVKYCGKSMLIHRAIATAFIRKTEEDILKSRNTIDHKTHSPKDYFVNDVRNLRWCTVAENNGFEETRNKQSLTRKGKTSNVKGHKWSEEKHNLFEKNKYCKNKTWKLVNGKRVWMEVTNG